MIIWWQGIVCLFYIPVSWQYYVTYVSVSSLLYNIIQHDIIHYVILLYSNFPLITVLFTLHFLVPSFFMNTIPIFRHSVFYTSLFLPILPIIFISSFPSALSSFYFEWFFMFFHEYFSQQSLLFFSPSFSLFYYFSSFFLSKKPSKA